MRKFADLYARAAERKGGEEVLEALIPKTKSTQALARISDDRWLAEMTRSVFQAGFVWRIVDAKWPAFEESFSAFDPYAVAYMSEIDFEQRLSDKNLIRHHTKMRAMRENAVFILDVAAEHGSAGHFFAHWPSNNYIGLLDVLKKCASRMGGRSAQYFLRRMELEAFLLTSDVCKVLVAEGVVTKAPTSKRDLQAVQDAFDRWCDESGRGLTAVSRVLAMSTE